MNEVLLIARVVLGLSLAAHGAQKLFGWFGGYGIAGTGGFFEKLGFRPGNLFALAAGLGEAGGGILTALGLFGPVGPALVILVMAVAILVVHARAGFFASANGFELPLSYATGALILAYTGPGLLSLDGLFGLLEISSPRTASIAVAAAVVIALLHAAFRRTEPLAAVKAS